MYQNKEAYQYNEIRTLIQIHLMAIVNSLQFSSWTIKSRVFCSCLCSQQPVTKVKQYEISHEIDICISFRTQSDSSTQWLDALIELIGHYVSDYYERPGQTGAFIYRNQWSETSTYWWRYKKLEVITEKRQWECLCHYNVLS